MQGNLLIEQDNAFEIISGFLSSIQMGNKHNAVEIMDDLMKQANLEAEAKNLPQTNSMTAELSEEELEADGYCLTCDIPISEKNGVQVDNEYIFCLNCCPDNLKPKEELVKESIDIESIKMSPIVAMYLGNMTSLQIKFNNITPGLGEGWNGKKLQCWDDAIICETGEAIESCDYKWWKAGDFDQSNVIVENIDLMHFEMSKQLENLNEEQVQKNIVAGFNIFETSKIFELIGEMNYDELSAFIRARFRNILKLTLMDNINYYPTIWANIITIMYCTSMFKDLEITAESCLKVMYVNYLVKNCLNTFRQKNGYKKGTYIKIWNGEEDNVRVFDFVATLEESNIVEKSLFDFMEASYEVIKFEEENKMKEENK